MAGFAQIGIALGALGMVLTLMGLFPDVTGLEPGRGVGVVQFAAILIGFSLLILGALMYVKFTFYLQRASTFSQQIGVRLAITGLVLAGLGGLADFLGFGSHLPAPDVAPVLGPLQALGVIAGFVISSLGVVVFAVMGRPPDEGE
jgi:uncharacterized membrane protein